MTRNESSFILPGGVLMPDPINFNEIGRANGYSSDEDEDSDVPEGREIGMDALAEALMNRAQQDDPMPKPMRSVVDKIFTLIDLTNVGMGAALSFVGWGICVLGVGTIVHASLTAPFSIMNSEGFGLLYSHLMETSAIPMLIIGIIMTIVGKDFATGQEMLQGIAQNIPYIIANSVLGNGAHGGYDHSPFRGGGFAF